MDRYPVNSVAAETAVARPVSAVETNKVLRNTYLLLAATLLFSAASAGLSLAMGAPRLGLLVTLVGYFALLFGVYKLRNSAWGVLMVFGLTGFLGFTLGPILSTYLTALPNGSSIVMNAFGITGLTFVALSAYAVKSRKDFSFMGGFLFVGVIAAFLLGLAAFFFELSALSLAVSGMFVLLSSGLILWQTSEIVNGGETNYVMATVSLYVSLFNLFTSLLHLLGFASQE
ncbi:MAG: Bax inhibitor-1/YccA family protein [Steroidobacteraceae bacterium]|jgi:modulator of FtsH protease|nr:Bax inhibitor-1/YccA family protein [Steroidobacteraceae bacterium]